MSTITLSSTVKHWMAKPDFANAYDIHGDTLLTLSVEPSL